MRIDPLYAFSFSFWISAELSDTLRAESVWIYRALAYVAINWPCWVFVAGSPGVLAPLLGSARRRKTVFNFREGVPPPFPVAAAAPVQPPDREDCSMAGLFFCLSISLI